MRFAREWFQRHSEAVTWYRGMWCSCTSQVDSLGNPNPIPDPSQADPTCQVCGGLGWFVMSPPQTIHGVISKYVQDKDMESPGFIDDGTLVFSQPPGVGTRLSDLDLIIPQWPDGVTYMGQDVARGAGVSDDLQYQVAKVISVTQSDPSTGAVTTYDPSDYTTSGRQITWIGASPALGTVYSIKYTTFYEYVCYIPPQERFERATDLGQRVILWKRHIKYPNAPNILES